MMQKMLDCIHERWFPLRTQDDKDYIMKSFSPVTIILNEHQKKDEVMPLYNDKAIVALTRLKKVSTLSYIWGH